jgi:amino acid transporter
MVLLLINGVIGAGIFGLPSKAFKAIGIWSLPAFVLCAAAVFIIILCFAEVSSRFEKTGGPYLYALHAFGQLPAFLTGWLLLITRFITYAALINLLITYLSVYSQWFLLPNARVITIIALTALLTLINHIGIEDTTRFNNIMTMAKLTALGLFIIVGFFYVDFSRFTAVAFPGLHSMSSTILLLIFSFGGFESVLVNTGEMQEPGKNLPYALLTATAIISGIYLFIQFVSIGTFPGLADSEKPLAEAAGIFMGRAGSVFIATGAVLSITGTLNAIMLTGSRLPYAFSEQNHFPPLFSFVHARFRTPTWSLLLFSSVTGVVAVFNSFVNAATISAITRVMIYGIVCFALLRLRKKMDKPATFILPYGHFFSFSGIAIAMWLLTVSPYTNMRDVMIAMIIGVLIFYAVRYYYSSKR